MMQPPSAPPIQPVVNQAPAAPPVVPAATTLSAAKPAAGTFALDGYCPVQLTEKKVWTHGDTRWGAIHQGQTYLFAGPEEQKRFFADPDRFAPVNAGNDIVLAVEKKEAARGFRKHGVYYGGRVYLFAGDASMKKFQRQPPLLHRAVGRDRPRRRGRGPAAITAVAVLTRLAAIALLWGHRRKKARRADVLRTAR